MEQYTLIGHPLGHSMSPFIHERLFAMAGKEASYTLTDIAPEHLEGKEPFLRGLRGFPWWMSWTKVQSAMNPSTA